MSSPFPGMDPYLESPAFWSDFHARFIYNWCDALADLLADQYEVRIDERVNLVEVLPEKIRHFAPDVAITQGPRPPGASSAPSGVATLEPVVVPLLIEEETRETYIQLLHRRDRTLVAVLELLSPANKEEPDRSTYLARRNTLLHRDVHVVELDLLLKGQRIPLAEAYPAGDYFALVADATRRPNCDVYRWTMRQPLPRIPIPLRRPDPAVWIDLAAVFAITYERGRYARSIDYTQPPPISLRGDELTWALERARSSPAT
jgi:hypothetical protein